MPGHVEPTWVVSLPFAAAGRRRQTATQGATSEDADKMPFKFTGKLEKVTIELEPLPLGTRGNIGRLEREAALKK